jgi:formate dehydrogenase major subunit
VQRVRKAVEPPGDAWDDWKITAEISKHMGTPMPFADSEAVFSEIARVTPSYAGLTYERIEHKGIHWPCPNSEHPGTPILHIDKFASGKGVFFGIEWVAPAETTDSDYPMYLTTGRLLYHYHTGTMTMRTDGLNSIAPSCYVEISREDADSQGLTEGMKIRVESRRGRIEAGVKVSDKAVAGTIFIPFHFAAAAANRLTHAALDPISGIPEFKVCAVKLIKPT